MLYDIFHTLHKEIVTSLTTLKASESSFGILFYIAAVDFGFVTTILHFHK